MTDVLCLRMIFTDDIKKEAILFLEENGFYGRSSFFFLKKIVFDSRTINLRVSFDDIEAIGGSCFISIRDSQSVTPSSVTPSFSMEYPYFHLLIFTELVSKLDLILKDSRYLNCHSYLNINIKSACAFYIDNEDAIFKCNNCDEFFDHKLLE